MKEKEEIIRDLTEKMYVYCICSGLSRDNAIKVADICLDMINRLKKNSDNSAVFCGVSFYLYYRLIIESQTKMKPKMDTALDFISSIGFEPEEALDILILGNKEFENLKTNHKELMESVILFCFYLSKFIGDEVDVEWKY